MLKFFTDLRLRFFTDFQYFKRNIGPMILTLIGLYLAALFGAWAMMTYYESLPG